MIKCRECKSLMLVSYLGNQLCKDCDKKYIRMINAVCGKWEMNLCDIYGLFYAVVTTMAPL